MEKIRDLQMATGKHAKTKVADIQRLYSKWLWSVTVVYKLSFADTCKNIIQKWLDSQGKFPPLGDSNEYSFYA